MTGFFQQNLDNQEAQTKNLENLIEETTANNKQLLITKNRIMKCFGGTTANAFSVHADEIHKVWKENNDSLAKFTKNLRQGTAKFKQQEKTNASYFRDGIQDTAGSSNRGSRSGKAGKSSSSIETSPRPFPSSTDLNRDGARKKLEGYCLNEEHPLGGNKAKVFRSALGFTKDNLDIMLEQIVFDPSTAIQRGTDEYGTSYNQTILMVSEDGGKQANVLCAFKHLPTGILNLVTAYVK